MVADMQLAFWGGGWRVERFYFLVVLAVLRYFLIILAFCVKKLLFLAKNRLTGPF